MAKSNSVFRLKITLGNIKPPIWRRVEVKDCSLTELHDIIQICLGWTGSHLWAFEIDGEQYGEDPEGEMEMASAAKARVSDFAGAGKKFRYVYDFGDNWEHNIEVEKVEAADPKATYPRCTKGSRSGPPEDCGGSWGYGDLLEALKNPRHEQHEEMKEWLGDEFDPEEFDIHEINRDLLEVA